MASLQLIVLLCAGVMFVVWSIHIILVPEHLHANPANLVSSIPGQFPTGNAHRTSSNDGEHLEPLLMKLQSRVASLEEKSSSKELLVHSLRAELQTLKKSSEQKVKRLEEDVRNARSEVRRMKTSVRSVSSSSNNGGGASSISVGHNPVPHAPLTSNQKNKNGLTQLNDDEMDVLDRILYWKRERVSVAEIHKHFPPHKDKYVVHENDSGGFNNLRMAIENVLLWVWITGRTFVTSPRHGWYLIDWGPMTRDKVTKKKRQYTKDESFKYETSDWDTFFDMDDLRKVVPQISAYEHMKREASKLQAPDPLPNYRSVHWFDYRKKWQDFFRTSNKCYQVSESPLSAALYYPTIPKVEAAKSWRHDDRQVGGWLDGRKTVEYSKAMQEKDCMYFSNKARFLGNTAAVVAFDDVEVGERERLLYRLLKYHFHYKEEVFRIAAKAIAFMGLWKYSSMHVRRNDLQYKQVFITGERTMKNVGALFKKKEVLYIATDVTDPKFFSYIEKRHHVIQWKDFFTDRGGNALKDVKIDRKLIGLIEQVICAGARVFVGTQFSTFSGFIPRLRGYMGAPNTELYFGTKKYTGDLAHDRRESENIRVVGQSYFHYMRVLWEGI